MDHIKNMLKLKNWAVIGASPNKEKPVYEIINMLKEYGYNVYCINPNYDKIDEMICYKAIEDLPVAPDVINIVVPVSAAKQIVKNLDSNKYKNLWFQPGAFDDETAELANAKGFNVIADGSCVMVALTLSE